MLEFDFFVELDTDIEECVNGELGADNGARTVMGVEFEEIKKRFWQDYVSLGRRLLAWPPSLPMTIERLTFHAR